METSQHAPDGYTIRRAEPAEFGALPAIERAAAALFRATVFPSSFR